LNNQFSKLQNDILRQIISDKNPAVLSRKLGYKFNQVSRWLNNSKQLKWDEFIELCYLVKYPIDSLLEETFGISVSTKAECKKAVIKILSSQSEQKKKIGSVLQKSRPSIYRLQKAKAVPTFINVLKIIDLKPHRLKKFSDAIILKDKQVGKTSLFSVPWLSIVSSAMAQKAHLSLPAYSPKWIAERVKLTIDQVELAVKVMLENELIEMKGKHYGPTMARTLALNHQRSRSEFLNLLRYWIKRSLLAVDFHEKQNTESDRFMGVFRTFMTTKETAAQINLLISELEEKIHNLISSAEGEKTEIRSFVFTHFDVSDI
jgi:hypothetical protein